MSNKKRKWQRPIATWLTANGNTKELSGPDPFECQGTAVHARGPYHRATGHEACVGQISVTRMTSQLRVGMATAILVANADQATGPS